MLVNDSGVGWKQFMVLLQGVHPQMLMSLRSSRRLAMSAVRHALFVFLGYPSVASRLPYAGRTSFEWQYLASFVRSPGLSEPFF
jgi:hypothetical protein